MPSTNCALQVVPPLPQSIPAGELCTLPLPPMLTVSVNSCLKVAVTLMSPFIVSSQVPVPLQPPFDQPSKTQPLALVAVSVTPVPSLNVALHVPDEQLLMPAGTDETLPCPTMVTESVCVGTNVAVTASSIIMLTVQVPVALVHAPDQPVKA